MTIVRLIVGLLIGICIGTITVSAQRKNTAEQSAVRQVEDAVAVATDKNDADALDKLWAPDYIFVNPAGLVLTKADRLTLFRSGRIKLESYSRDQETTRIYGNIAIVVYRSLVKGKRGDEDISSRRRVTTVLEKRQGHWWIISQQSTPIAASE